MKRTDYAFALLAALVLALPARASMQRRPAPDCEVQFDAKKGAEQDAREAARRGPELLLTEATEVLLDGKACRYADVPETAEIVLLEVSADRTEIRKIHFRSKP
jgi:hypothetical protein